MEDTQDIQHTQDQVIEIEFFHDVLCAWCYALSPRMRRLVSEHPEIRVIHRAFALAPTPESLINMFGSKEKAKEEILNHWRAANLNDDEHRDRPDLMEDKPFDYPYSMPGLVACKAAERQGGQKAHWDMFDRIQRAHLTETQNIADYNVLKQCAIDIGLDVQRWEEDYRSRTIIDEVREDLSRAEEYGITGVPTLVAAGQYALVGAQKYEQLEKWYEQVLERLTTSNQNT